MKFCYLGIDGGGTKTVGVAVDEQGNVLCRKEESSINYCSVGMENALHALSRIADALIQEAGCPAVSLAIGSSALDERIRDGLYREFINRISNDEVLGKIEHVEVHSDARMALLAACGKERGALLISGTGVMGLAADGSSLHSVAGWGDVIGDRGSGYAIGLAGISAALDYTDGLNTDAEALFLAMCEFYSIQSAAELIALIYSPDFDKSRIAAFCACVCALAERKDARSVEILNDAAEDLVRYCISLGNFLGQKPFPLAFYGSVLTKNEYIRNRVTNALKVRLPQAEIITPTLAAEDAAALYALERTKNEQSTRIL
ncbi:MAG: hypothetical protein IKT43_03775 [Clostridia bacterium]|nr:hypothetical protein [Clostridia bacterium]